MRGHRLVHALVNTLMVTEAAGKSGAVHRVVRRRLGRRVVGGEVLTRKSLRDLLSHEQSKQMIIAQIMSLGKDVRSTPVHWAYQQKLLDMAVKTLSWRPPFVEDPDVPVAADPLMKFLGNFTHVKDRLGLGRILSICGGH